MKSILLLIGLLVAAQLFATQAPKAVADAFQQKFAGAANVKWEKENEQEFEAWFDMQGKKMSANFNVLGQWLQTITEVGLDGLPAVVKVVLQTRFLDWDISNAYKIEKADKPEVYRSKLSKNGLFKEVSIKPNGDIINDK